MRMRRHAGTRTDLYWEYQPGEQVMTIDHIAGRVLAVHDGPVAGHEEYEVELVNGLGGGRYTAAQLAPLESREAATRTAGEHVTAAEVLAVGHHIATEDYPELGSILDDRPDPGKLTFNAAKVVPSQERAEADAEDHDEPDPEIIDPTMGQDQPSSCSYCGGTEFKNQTDNGRVRQATCATCGGTMSAHPGATWTPELIGDPSNHPSTTVDPTSGASGAGGQAGINDFIDFDSRVSTTAAVDGPDWCTWRQAAQCTYPNDRNSTLLPIPQVRGACPWETRWQQQVCPISEPGPGAGMARKGSVFLPEGVESSDQHTAALEAHMAADDDDYRMQHQAPDADYGAPLHDVTMHMHDFYEHPEYYNHGQEHFHDSAHVIHRARNQPEKMINIYRALPGEHAHKGIRPGDWVSTSKDYARGEGRMHDSKDDYPVIHARVPAKHLHTEGDVHEWGYNGPATVPGTVVYKGGYNQEVRHNAQGEIKQVKRKPKSPDKLRAEKLEEHGYSFSHYKPNQHGEGNHDVAVYDKDDNWAGHLRADSNGNVMHVEISPEHRHLPLEEHMRSMLPKTGVRAAMTRLAGQLADALGPGSANR